jgi:uncharacterized repeat protein (TIGR01451 family)
MSGPPALFPHSVSAILSNGLTATLTEDRSVVSVGGAVTYTATLTNATAQPITYQPILSGTNSFSVPASLVVKNSTGQVVFPSGATATFVGIGPSVTLAAGQSMTGAATVSTLDNSGYTFTPGYGSGGTYSATAVFGIVPSRPLPPRQGPQRSARSS